MHTQLRSLFVRLTAYNGEIKKIAVTLNFNAEMDLESETTVSALKLDFSSLGITVGARSR